MEKIQIIHSNDIHSNYESFLRIASKIKQIKENDCIILDAGDFNDFSSYVTKGNKGYTENSPVRRRLRRIVRVRRAGGTGHGKQ